MIVKVASSQHRTAVYKSRKKSRKEQIRLELTARRSKVFKHANYRVAASSTVDFAFADINCRLGLKTNESAFKFFDDEHEFEHVLEKTRSQFPPHSFSFVRFVSLLNILLFLIYLICYLW